MPDRLGIGGNFPPTEIIIDPHDPDILRARLGRDYAEMARRFVELAQGAERITEITDEHHAGEVGDFIGQQCGGLIEEAQVAHKREKRPFLTSGRVVDDFFLRRRDELMGAIVPVKRLLERFHAEKRRQQRAREAAERQAAEQRRRDELARQAALDAERAKKQAAGDRPAAIVLGLQAKEAGQRAAENQAIIEAPSAPVHIRGDFGSTQYTKEAWDFEIMDPLAIPFDYLMPDEAAIRRAIARGVRDIPGLRIFEDPKFVIKRC